MQNENLRHRLAIFLFLTLTVPLLNGCAGKRLISPEAGIVRQNDKVAVSYTCKLADGALAATNERQSAEEQNIIRSPLFSMPDSFGPEVMTATAKPVIDPAGHTEIYGFKVKSFEEAVREQLAGRLIGLPYDKECPLRLSADVPKGLSRRDRYLKRYRETSHPKVLRVPLWQVAKRLNEPPAAGASWQGKDGITFVVESVSGKIVKLRREIKSGAVVKTIFGPARIIDKGRFYTIDIEPKVGTVVRSGPLAGRIVKVTDKYFLLDYGNPFGFETLNCRVRIEQPAADTTGTDAAGHDVN